MFCIIYYLLCHICWFLFRKSIIHFLYLYFLSSALITFNHMIFLFLSFWDKHMTCLLTLELALANQRFLPASWSLARTFYPPYPHWELFQGPSLERAVWCSAHLNSVPHWTQLKLLRKLLRFGGGRALWLSEPHLWVPLLIKPSTYQSAVAASYFGLCLPFLYRSQNMNQHLLLHPWSAS